MAIELQYSLHTALANTTHTHTLATVARGGAKRCIAPHLRTEYDQAQITKQLPLSAHRTYSNGESRT